MPVSLFWRMKHLIMVLTICATVLWRTAALSADEKKDDAAKKEDAAKKMDAFPSVALVTASAPYYTALAMDPWKEKVAYVVFDGSLANGYGRIYVWTPDDPQYRTPTAFNSVDGQSFPPFTMNSRRAGEKSSVTWKLSWAKHTSGGGSGGHWDYGSGKWIEGTVGKVTTYSAFYFSVTYQRGPEVGTTTWPLDISTSGPLGVATDWKQRPGALAPWYGLTISMSPKYVHEKGEISFGGALRYSYQSPCVVRSLPDEARITLLVSPYHEPPVYSNNSLTAAEVFGSGIGVPLEYGWYNFSWNMSCPGLSVSPWHDHRTYPYAFAKPAAMK